MERGTIVASRESAKFTANEIGSIQCKVRMEIPYICVCVCVTVYQWMPRGSINQHKRGTQIEE